jgi:hypothetical protein
MCNSSMLMGAGAGMSAAGAYGEAKATKNSLLYEADVADQNAQISEWQGQDALHRGQLDEQSSRLQTAAVKGAQRAAMAANGVVVGEGSSNDVLSTTDYTGETDALAIRNNALRTAWGYSVQSTNYKDSARNLRQGAKQIKPWLSAVSSLIGSASSVASSNYLLSKASVGIPATTTKKD